MLLLALTCYACIDLLLVSLESHSPIWRVHELRLDPRTAGVAVRDALSGSTMVHDVLALSAASGEAELLQIARVDPEPAQRLGLGHVSCSYKLRCVLELDTWRRGLVS